MASDTRRPPTKTFPNAKAALGNAKRLEAKGDISKKEMKGVAAFAKGSKGKPR